MCNCSKNLCFYPKFTQKLKSSRIPVKLRLSTYRFSSAESMASLRVRLTWNVIKVILVINHLGKSSMELLPFMRGISLPQAEEIHPARTHFYTPQEERTCAYSCFKNLEHLLNLMHCRNHLVNTKNFDLYLHF